MFRMVKQNNYKHVCIINAHLETDKVLQKQKVDAKSGTKMADIYRRKMIFQYGQFITFTNRGNSSHFHINHTDYHCKAD